LDYDRVRFLPRNENNVDLTKVVFKAYLLDSTSNYVNTYDKIGFTDEDIKFRRNNFKYSFLKLLFYDTDNPLTQKLVTYTTLYCRLNSGDYLPYNTSVGIAGQPKPIGQIPVNFELDNPILTPKGNSEGFYLYDYKDSLKIGESKYLYMKAVFNNAKTGKSVNMMVKSSAQAVEKLVHELYTKVKLYRTSTGFYYLFDDTYQGNTAAPTNNVTFGSNNVTVTLNQVKAI
jgi:hypothetical protein